MSGRGSTIKPPPPAMLALAAAGVLALAGCAQTPSTPTLASPQTPPPYRGVHGRAYVVDDTAVSVIDTRTDTVTATIAAPQGSRPLAATLSPDGTRLYIANASAGISVIDTRTNTVTATITLPQQWTANAVALSPDGTRAYAVDITSPDIEVIDTRADTVTATITVHPFNTPNPDLIGNVGGGFAGAWDIVVNATGTRAFAVGDGGVWVVDTATDQVAATIPVAGGSIVSDKDSEALSPDGTRLYVTQASSPTLSVIDTGADTLTASIPIGYLPHAVAVNPATGQVYVTDMTGPGGLDRVVSAINPATNQVTATIPVNSNGLLPCLALDPAGARLYVTDDEPTGLVAVIDTRTDTVTATIRGFTRPAHIAVSPP